jgi:hypothetical protein
MGKQLYKPASKASRALMSSWLTGSKPQAEAGHPGAAGAAAVEPRAVASHPIEIEIDSDGLKRRIAAWSRCKAV